ncbi:hypothetical protein BH23ACT5_BH23ACT5_07430 [soil metagenome]
MTTRAQLQEKSIGELRAIAESVGIETDGLQKSKLISQIMDRDGGESVSSDAVAEVNLPTATPREASPDQGDETSRSSNGAGPSGDDQSDARDDNAGQGAARGNSSDDIDDDDNRGNRNRNRRKRNRSRNPQGGGGSGGGGGGGYEQQPEGDQEVREGLLDILPEGYGFLRTSGYLPSDRDVYVSAGQVRKFGLRKGDLVAGPVRLPRSQEKFPALTRIDTVNGGDVQEARNRVRFESLTPLFPDSRLRLEVPGEGDSTLTRIVDLIAPIGKGQRGLIVSPPKAGKTTVLKEIATSITANNPECYLMMVLVGERPEEVTDMQRSVKGEVVYSTFDQPAEEHTQVSELALERAKRLVEAGTDVVILLDSITRLARAHNLATPASGRILSGGVDSTALYPPKRFFGAARNIEEGGSLTILGTALVETGSKMDEVIFEEFKGTGNMELRLDRKLADKRIYPAIDIESSGTRREELLFDSKELAQVWKLRRVLLALEPGAALELLIDRLKNTVSNPEFLSEVAKSGN